MKVLDTFAGAGGFSLGFEMAGFEIVGAIERDKWASDTYKENHSNVNVVVGDITELTDDYILEQFSLNRPDVILGGPPCQGFFSIANRNSGDPKDPRNSLFEEFLRVGKLLNPDVMIMENVPNLIKSKTANKEKVIDIIVSEMEDMGYNVYVKILEAYNYGIPQLRKRLFVIASKKKLEKPFPDETHSTELTLNGLLPTPILWDAISDLPDIEAREGSEEMDYVSDALNPYQEMLRQNSSKVYNHKAMNHTKKNG